ncbi:MAG: pyridoxamine 5'-phosphate oxidase family protein [Actinomycetota bacterium]
MASWRDIAASEPDFANTVQARFDKYRHKVLATIRKDGSPRVSGLEAEFRDGDVWFGMMPGSLKLADIERDPRIALHCGTEDPPEPPPPGFIVDAKLSGRAVLEAPPLEAHEPPGPRFHIDIDDVVLVSLGDPADHLVIQHWHEGIGLRSTKRY